jgi:hypothetical protein
MHHFQMPAWYHAITLTERIAALREPPRKISKIDTDLAMRRADRWRAQAPFANHAYLAQRLVQDGITEDEWLYLLGEPIAALSARFPAPPAWLVDLAQAFACPISSNLQTLLPEALQNQDSAGFWT